MEGGSRKNLYVCMQVVKLLSIQPVRGFYQHKLLKFRSFHLVFVDGSGCDNRVGHRRTGWSPLGVTPIQVSKFHRGQRYQILPAYAQDGVVLSRIFKGSTDGSFFESFIEQLLQPCGRWIQPKSVLVMDNASSIVRTGSGCGVVLA
jgi:hypothetical protein